MAQGSLRASAVLAGFFGFTLPLMPVQALLLKVSPAAARRFPNWYHRNVCRILGVKLKIEGQVVDDKPVLLVCNHTSWLDIPVLSAVAPVSFVAKLEVGSWPFVSALARLQRSVFVDRTRRQATGDAATEIMQRLKLGDTIVLFAEGTSSDGNRVLPFKTSLFGAVSGQGATGNGDVVVQTAAVVYTHLPRRPPTRADRPRIGWYGDMEMTSHAWGCSNPDRSRQRSRSARPSRFRNSRIARTWRSRPNAPSVPQSSAFCAAAPMTRLSSPSSRARKSAVRNWACLRPAARNGHSRPILCYALASQEA
ncbi:lysophospholipid acyltransferase family protein [Bradyrhizobium sp. RDI18]|uniref:lysophospholipid acyltransferase family protein n=1 Tax=Bradyrhizobium sp. RDI18 TaxID=3367400 RepID=UPI00371FDEB2